LNRAWLSVGMTDKQARDQPAVCEAPLCQESFDLVGLHQPQRGEAWRTQDNRRLALSVHLAVIAAVAFEIDALIRPITFRVSAEDVIHDRPGVSREARDRLVVLAQDARKALRCRVFDN